MALVAAKIIQPEKDGLIKRFAICFDNPMKTPREVFELNFFPKLGESYSDFLKNLHEKFNLPEMLPSANPEIATSAQSLKCVKILAAPDFQGSSKDRGSRWTVDITW